MKKTISAVLFLCIVITLLLQSAGLAWMSDNGMSSPVHITSNVHKQYFEGGTGEVDDPYQIASPIQLYYFAWLQYLGYFNTEDKDDNGKIDTFYFVLNNDIDMHEVNSDGERIEYILPPIGTTDNPFIGNFDGAGHTVKNATVENLYSSLIEPPEQTTEENFEGVEIIGFFGVVGEIKGEHKYDYSSSANEVKNLVLENLTVKTQTKKSLIGLVAGYVNGIVDCVGIMGGTVNIVNGVEALSFTANISDYSLIGYCEDDYKDSVYVMDVVLSKPTTSDTYEVVPDMTEGGSSQGWGGSIKMLDIYNLIQNYQNNQYNQNIEYQTGFNYIISRVDRVGLDGKRVTVDQETSSMIVADIISNENGKSEHHGSFIFSQMSQGNTMNINFVSGSQQVTLFEYVKDENSSVPLYHITDGAGHYLSLNGMTITSTNQANATAWYVEDTANGKVIYALVGNTIYYLNTSGTNVVVTSYLDLEDFENPPAWEQVDNTYALNDYQLEYNENSSNWVVSQDSGGVRIYYTPDNGTTKYYILRNGSNSTLSATTNPEEASLWTRAVNGNGYTFSTLINGRSYYVRRNNNTVQLSTTSTTWRINNANNQIYYTSGNRTYYLQYNTNNNTWVTNTTSATAGIEEVIIDRSASTESSGTSGAEIRLQKNIYVDNSPTNSYYDANGNLTHNLKSNGDAAPGVSYIPLSFDTENKTNKTLSGNTGYIISSKYGDINKGEIDQYGNIRISRYGQGSILNPDEPYTITYKTGTNAENAKFKTIQNTTTAHLSSLGLQKYDKCDDKISESIATSCYGLHFMEASVTMDNLTEITATLLGETYYNYEVPTNCIDFRLFDRGFVNCYAGSYFTSNGVNDSFFSLYEISRDEETLKITGIKEIYKIYGKVIGEGENRTIDTSEPYVYTYQQMTEGGIVGEKEYIEEVGIENVPADYVEIFNCMWMIYPDSPEYYGTGVAEDPTKWVVNQGGYNSSSTGYAYYYEVPVNAGEYALGSSAGRTGAYLLYLDLAANAQVIERYQEAEKIVEEKTETSVPKGVELLAPGETSSTVDPLDSAFVSINTKGDGTTAASGDISYSTADGITITHSATSGTSAEYIGANNVLQDGNRNPMELQGVTTEIIRTTYRDYNKTTKETIVTVITKTTVDGGEPTYKRTITKTSADGEVTVTEDTKSEPETASAGETQASAGEELIRLYFAYGQTKNVTETGDVTIKENATIEYRYVPAEKDAQGNATTTPSYEITVTNSGTETVKLKAVLLQTGSGITFYVNGTALQDTTTAQIVEIAPSGGNSDPTP